MRQVRILLPEHKHMAVNKKHPNYTKTVPKVRVVKEASGPNRAARRGSKYRMLPKQFHVQGAQVHMMMVEKGLIKRTK